MEGNLTQAAPFEVELFDVLLTEHLSICDIASSDKFVTDYRQSGLQIFYCGAYVLFRRDGWADEAVSFNLVRRMRAKADVENVTGRRAEIEAERKLKDEAAKVIELDKKRQAEKQYLEQKEAMVAAKKANPNFDNAAVTAPSVEARALVTLETAVAAGYSLDAAHALVARNEALNAGMTDDEADQMADHALREFRERNPAPVAKTVEAADMVRDMKAERGTMGDEEERSMQAAIARSKKGRR